MKQKLLNSIRLRVCMLVAVLCAGFTSAWGESYNVTYDYSALRNMLSGSKSDANSYWKVPGTAGNSATIAIPIVYQPTSDITITFNIATFGNGTNPSSTNTTITAIGTENGSNWSGSGVSSYPSSSTYVNGVMTITKPNSPTTLSGLTITMGVNSGIKIFRLMSLTISYTYDNSSSAVATTTTIDASGISNTNLYVSTAAGSLSAVVKNASNVAIDGATVTWNGDNDDVATINSNGAVTLVGAGTVTFTATYAGVTDVYQSSSDTYEMTVTNEDPSLVTIWSEDFATDGYTDRTSSYSYMTTNSSAVQSGDSYAGGTKPEMMIKANGTFSATIPLNNGYTGNLHMSFMSNANSITVSSGTTGVSMSGTADFSTAGTHEVTFSGITAENTEINIVFTADSKNVRLDNIVLKGTRAPSYEINVQSNNNDFGSVTLDGTTITAEPGTGYRVIAGNGGYTVTEGNASVTNHGDNTFTVAPTSNCTVQINFEVIPIHSATFSVNGATTSSTIAEGAAITFPSDPVDIGGLVFQGWSASPIDGTTNEAPEFVPTATMGTSDVTYYAVFAASSSSFEWQKVTNLSTIGAGVYALLTTDGHAFNGTISSGHGQATTNAFSFTNNVATSVPEGICEITLQAVDGGYKMYNANYGYLYASAASSGKLAWHATENSYWKYGDSNWEYNSNKAFLRSYNNSSFRTYGSNNGSVLVFAKKTTIISNSGYCTSIPSITVTPATATPAASDVEGTLAITYENLSISDMDDFDIQYCDAQGHELASSNEPDWIMVEVASQDPQIGEGYVVSYIMLNPNTNNASRTAYFKVYALDDNTNVVYSNLVTITQAAPDPVTVTIGSVGYSTLYYGDRALVVPTDVKAYTYKVTNNKLEISSTYNAGATIPAGTAVVLKASADNYTFAVSSESGTEDANNVLRGTDVAATTTGGNYYYALSLNAQNEASSVGFYWMENDGVAFTCGAHKAYLALSSTFAAPAEGEVKSFFTLADIETAIKGIDANTEAAEIFNLAGQRLQKAQRGINIINGRKVVVK